MRLDLVTLLVRDYDEALAHYVGQLGFALIEDTPQGNGKRWVVVRPGGGAGLLLARADTDEQRAAMGRQTGGRVGFFLRTDDFTAEHARMVAAGVAFDGQPRTEPYGTVAVLVDRYGNRWDLVGPA